MHKIAGQNPFSSNWPDVGFIERLLAPALRNRILFGQVASMRYNVSRGKLSAEVDDLIQGTFFAGSWQAVHAYYSRFFQIHDQRKDMGLFVGKDQSVMNQVAFRFDEPEYEKNASAQLKCHSQFAVRLLVYNQRCSSITYDPWFWYQVYFARNPSLFCKNDRLTYLTDSIA